MTTDSPTPTSRTAGGQFTYLAFGYLMLRDIVDGYEDGRRDELHSHENIRNHARRVMLEALEFAGQADLVLSGAIGCPCCGGSEQSELGPRHGLYVHPAALLLFRIAAASQQAAAVASDEELNIETLQQVWVDDEVFSELLDDQETRRFLAQQTSEQSDFDALAAIYDKIGMAWR